MVMVMVTSCQTFVLFKQAHRAGKILAQADLFPPRWGELSPQP